MHWENLERKTNKRHFVYEQSRASTLKNELQNQLFNRRKDQVGQRRLGREAVRGKDKSAHRSCADRVRLCAHCVNGGNRPVSLLHFPVEANRCIDRNGTQHKMRSILPCTYRFSASFYTNPFSFSYLQKKSSFLRISQSNWPTTLNSPPRVSIMTSLGKSRNFSSKRRISTARR